MEYNLIVNQKNKLIDAVIKDQNIKALINNKNYDATFTNISEHQISLKINGQNINAFISKKKGTKTIHIKGQSYKVTDADLIEETSDAENNFIGNATSVVSPMPAVVIKIMVQVGDQVKKGQGLIMVSAMKMETTLFAPFDGVVSEINTREGDKVVPTDILVDIEQMEIKHD